jgi:hypothetical protein
MARMKAKVFRRERCNKRMAAIVSRPMAVVGRSIRLRWVS